MDQRMKESIEEGMKLALEAYDAIYANGCHDSFKFIFNTRRNYKPVQDQQGNILHQFADGKTVTIHDEVSGASFSWKASRFYHESTNIQPVISCFRLLVQEHFYVLYPNQNLSTVMREMMSDTFVEYMFPPDALKTELPKPIEDYWKATDVYHRYIKPIHNPLLSSRPPNLFL